MVSDFVKEKLINQYGQDAFEEILEGMECRCSSCRVNGLKSNSEEFEEAINGIGKISNSEVDYTKCDWYPEAYIFTQIDNTSEKTIRELDIYKDGKIYFQSLSSMIPALVLAPEAGENILDMCAAPGGKTTQMSVLSDNAALITACERDRIRCDRLKYNIEKQGAKSINVLNQDSTQLSDYFSFDKILLDAPCSGSGTLLLNAATNGDINEAYINKLVKIQRKLLDKALKILKKGGTLIYSTCSIFKEENDENISYILNKYKDIKLEPIPNKEKYTNMKLLPAKYDETMCIQPNKYYEGFFIAKIIKF